MYYSGIMKDNQGTLQAKKLITFTHQTLENSGKR